MFSLFSDNNPMESYNGETAALLMTILPLSYFFLPLPSPCQNPTPI